jgi:hypothetical protein
MRRINLLHKRYEKYRRINEVKQNESILNKWFHAVDVAIPGKKYDHPGVVYNIKELSG